MADADVTIKDGAGADRKVDSRTVGAGVDEHRQVVVIGDPTTAANVAVVSSGALLVDLLQVAHDAVDAGNPVKIGGKASSAAPTDVAAGDRVDAWLTAKGALVTTLTDSAGAAITTGTQYVEDSVLGTNGQGTLVVARRDNALSALTPVEGDAVGLRVNGTGALWVTQDVGTPASATAQYTTTQTSTILGPTNDTTVRPVVTSIQIQAGGTTAGAVQVYFGTGAYTRGTSGAIFDGEFAPSATSKPGYAQSPPVAYEGVAGDEIRVTTSAAVNPLTITVWYRLVAA